MGEGRSPLGVATSPASAPAWGPLVPPPAARPLHTPPAWTCPAQLAAGALLALAAGLLAWHGYRAHPRGARPSALEPGAVRSARVDLNRADHAELLQLRGVGEKLARRIEEERDRRGGFRSVDELRGVRGIGPEMLERLRPFLHVEPYEAEEEGPPPDRAGRKAPGPPPEVKPARGGKKPLPERPVDVNRASEEELRTLPGIGPTLARRIVQARARQPFRSAADLRRVKGIGPKILERLRPHVLVGEGDQ
jgi:competence protein ComEA